ncbi:pyruvate kinase [Bacillus anthracis]|nr:pyruvate kinase [Bacillus anthracis]
MGILMKKDGGNMTIDRVCTIGPASNNKETLAKLINNGMKIVRLNLSHGTHESHKDIIRLVKSLDDSIKILGDVQGPKIRLGEIKGEQITLQAGDSFMLRTQPVTGSSTEASVDYEGIANDVKVGSRILMNDGEVELIVEKVSTDKIETKVKTGGNISSHKGVNLPGQSLVYQLLQRKIKKIFSFF